MNLMPKGSELTAKNDWLAYFRRLSALKSGLFNGRY
jgi:hypothetical protein